MLRVPNLPEKEFKKLLKITPMIAVDIIIVNGKGEFLLEKRTYPPHTGSWHLPGGFMGYGERLADTAKRKSFQETGLKVGIMKYVGVYDKFGQDSRGHVVVHSFIARPAGGKLKKDGLKWFKKIPTGIGFKFQVKELKNAGFS